MNVDEFVATFDFLDKNGDGNLTKDEIRYIMTGMGYELAEDEIRDLMVDIGGVGTQAIDKAHFLHFCYTMTEGDVDQTLKECFKLTSAMTQTMADQKTMKSELCVTAYVYSNSKLERIFLLVNSNFFLFFHFS